MQTLFMRLKLMFFNPLGRVLGLRLKPTK